VTSDVIGNGLIHVISVIYTSDLYSFSLNIQPKAVFLNHWYVRSWKCVSN